MRLHDSYLQGMHLAIYELEKDAGVKDVFKNLLVAGGLLGGTISGALKGAKIGLKTSEPYEQVLSKVTKANTENFVPVSEFLAKYAPKIKRMSPDEYARFTIKDLQNDGKISKSIDVAREASLWQKDPFYKNLEKGNNVLFLQRKDQIVAGDLADPALIARAIGHSKVVKDPKLLASAADGYEARSLKNILMGNQYERESKAWEYANQLRYPHSKRVENASIRKFEEKRDRSRAGAASGGAVGFGGSGLGLLGLHALARSVRKKKVK